MLTSAVRLKRCFGRSVLVAIARGQVPQAGLETKEVEILRCNSLRQWREQYMPLMMKVDFEPYNNTPFNVSFRLPLGLPGVVRCRFSGGTLKRTAQLVKDEPDAFHLTTVETGRMTADERGRQRQFHRGEATVSYVAGAGSYSSSASFVGLGFIIPRAEFEARGVRPDDAVMQRLTSRCEALRLLRVYARSIEKSGMDHAGPFGTSTAVRQLVQRHLYDLAALAVSWPGAVGESQLGAVADVRLRAALDYIAAHFDDPWLTVDTVAQSQGISPRHLQYLLESSGYSYTAVVNELRLQKAYTALAADYGPRAVADIALQAGFTDISYFTRLFRARFGDTPGKVRALSVKLQ